LSPKRISRRQTLNEAKVETPNNVLRERLHLKENKIQKLTRDLSATRKEFEEFEEFSRLESQLVFGHHDREELLRQIEAKDQVLKVQMVSMALFTFYPLVHKTSYFNSKTV
jgi:hypothetical protein